MLLFGDLEVFSTTDIKLGGRKYSETAEILVYGYAIDEQPAKYWAPTLDPIPPIDLQQAVEEAHFVAHNHHFERAVTDACHGALGLEKVPVERWIDTQQWVQALALPRSLDLSAKALRLTKEKDPRGKALVRRFCIPQKPTKAQPDRVRIFPEDDPEGFQDLCEYCVTDVEVMRDIYYTLLPFRPQEPEIFAMDSEMNTKGIPVDVKTAIKAVHMLAGYEKERAARFREITGLNPTQVGKVTELMRTKCGMQNLQAETIIRKLEEPDLDPEIRELLEIRRSVSKASTKKLATLARAATGGRVRNCLRLYGATTGRWTGEILQPHNFIKPAIKDSLNAYKLIEAGDIDFLDMVYGDPMVTIASCMRHFIRAPKGEEMHIGDLASIEARIGMLARGAS